MLIVIFFGIFSTKNMQAENLKLREEGKSIKMAKAGVLPIEGRGGSNEFSGR